MHTAILHSLGALSSAQWNALAGENPFLKHEFLLALEDARCVGDGTGWEPHYLVAFADAKRAELLGAVPLYLKRHSYGEYVFDWSWADACEHAGRPYYPKLVAAIPFTPATGKRLLIAPAADHTKTSACLIAGAREAADRTGASSLHWLFPTGAELDLLTRAGFLARAGCQFHWSNGGYRDFEDFLDAFTSQKRNNIRRERRRVREAGVTVQVLHGDAITTAWWDVFYHFYRATVRAHGAMAYLTREFFHTIGAALPEHTVLVVAQQGREPVGVAFGMRSSHTYYGRYWGGRRDMPGLHFETCYYTPIEYCIAEGIARYEAGAQGEHKHARGFVPTPTHSAHWLRDAQLRRAVADFVSHEQGHVERYMNEMNEHGPFRDRRN